MSENNIVNKVHQFFNWYIKGEYHCDKCLYCWGGGYNAGCGDYDDCGCYIKGDIRDTCMSDTQEAIGTIFDTPTN